MKVNNLKVGILSTLFLLSILFSTNALADEKPDLFLLKTYNKSKHVDIDGWLMSEKLDGVRAYWDGKKLYSRGGHTFAAPSWFIKGLPDFPLDGELWTKRGDFEAIVSIVRQKQAHDGWGKITYQIFEVPKAKGNFFKRLAKIKGFLHKKSLSHLHVIKQISCKGKEHLEQFMQKKVRLGGEGVVIRNPVLNYYSGRNAQSLKVKQTQDADCRVTGYKAGKGKYQGKVGALYCQTSDQQELTIGTGLSDREREFPPNIGSLITYKYYGLTAKKKPRFPVFLRQRIIEP